MLLNCGIGEDSWESLGCKEIQPVHPKGDQSWVFIVRTDFEAETPILWATWCEELNHLKRPWCWESLRAGEGDNTGWNDWLPSPSQWTWVWVNSMSWYNCTFFQIWLLLINVYFWVFNVYFWASLIAQLVKNPLEMQETQVWSLGGEDPLEKG